MHLVLALMRKPEQIHGVCILSNGICDVVAFDGGLSVPASGKKLVMRDAVHIWRSCKLRIDCIYIIRKMFGCLCVP